jgi:hypothetical protein
MFGWIIGPSLLFGFLLLTFSVTLLIFRTEWLRGMPIDAFPWPARPKVDSQTAGLAMTAA